VDSAGADCPRRAIARRHQLRTTLTRERRRGGAGTARPAGNRAQQR
jgi:hypothetical protein